MVVQIVHVEGVAVLEPERHPPVPRHGHCVMPPKAALEGVQPEAGEVHALRVRTAVEGGQDTEQLRRVAGCGP